MGCTDILVKHHSRCAVRVFGGGMDGAQKADYAPSCPHVGGPHPVS